MKENTMKKKVFGILAAALVTAMVLTGCVPVEYYNTAKITIKSTATKNTSAYNSYTNNGTYIGNALPGVHITWIYEPGYNADVDAGDGLSAAEKATLRKLQVMAAAQANTEVTNERTFYVESGKTYKLTFQVVMPDGRIAWGTTDTFEAEFYEDYVFIFDGNNITSNTSIDISSWVNAVLKDGASLLTNESISPDSGSLQKPNDGHWVYYDPKTDYGIGYGPRGGGSYNPSLSVQK